MSLDQLVNEALRLSERDRAALAAALIESLDRAEEGVCRPADGLDRDAIAPVPWQIAWDDVCAGPET